MSVRKTIYLEYDLPFEQVNSSANNGLETPVLLPSNTLTITITDVQFKEFLSALEQGAEILYPDKVHEMTDIFLQGVP